MSKRPDSVLTCSKETLRKMKIASAILGGTIRDHADSAVAIYLMKHRKKLPSDLVAGHSVKS